MANKRIQKKQVKEVQQEEIKEVVVELQPEVKEEVKPVVNKFVEEMKAIDTQNKGNAHHAAVGVLIGALLESGQDELVNAWLEVAKKVGGFDYV